MRVAMIAALSRNRVIGRDNALPWHLPEDLKYFKRVTMGKPLLMGRKTYESIGRALPGRTNIVLTRQPEFAAPGIVVVADPQQALELARAEGAEELMVIGGEEIYRVMLPRCSRLYLTEVDVQAEGDAYFPDIDPAQWHQLRREAFPAGDAGGNGYSFVLLERRGEDH
jgi:dihydrofolate reductase